MATPSSSSFQPFNIQLETTTFTVVNITHSPTPRTTTLHLLPLPSSPTPPSRHQSRPKPPPTPTPTPITRTLHECIIESTRLGLARPLSRLLALFTPSGTIPGLVQALLLAASLGGHGHCECLVLLVEALPLALPPVLDGLSHGQALALLQSLIADLPRFDLPQVQRAAGPRAAAALEQVLALLAQLLTQPTLLDRLVPLREQLYAKSPSLFQLGLEAFDGHGNTALHLAAAHGRREALQLLLERGAQCDTRNFRKRSALASAAVEGHLECVRLLLEAGASPRAVDHWQHTAASLACFRGHADIVRLLVPHLGDLSPLLHWAVRGGHSTVTRILLASGAESTAIHDGITPLHIAVAQRDLRCMRELLQHEPTLPSIRATSTCKEFGVKSNKRPLDMVSASSPDELERRCHDLLRRPAAAHADLPDDDALSIQRARVRQEVENDTSFRALANSPAFQRHFAVVSSSAPHGRRLRGRPCFFYKRPRVFVSAEDFEEFAAALPSGKRSAARRLWETKKLKAQQLEDGATAEGARLKLDEFKKLSGSSDSVLVSPWSAPHQPPQPLDRILDDESAVDLLPAFEDDSVTLHHDVRADQPHPEALFFCDGDAGGEPSPDDLPFRESLVQHFATLRSSSTYQCTLSSLDVALWHNVELLLRRTSPIFTASDVADRELWVGANHELLRSLGLSTSDVSSSAPLQRRVLVRGTELAREQVVLEWSDWTCFSSADGLPYPFELTDTPLLSCDDTLQSGPFLIRRSVSRVWPPSTTDHRSTLAPYLALLMCELHHDAQSLPCALYTSAVSSSTTSETFSVNVLVISTDGAPFRAPAAISLVINNVDDVEPLVYDPLATSAAGVNLATLLQGQRRGSAQDLTLELVRYLAMHAAPLLQDDFVRYTLDALQEPAPTGLPAYDPTWPLSPPNSTATVPLVRIASFNLGGFSSASAKNPTQLFSLAQALAQFDVVAVQELTDLESDSFREFQQHMGRLGFAPVLAEQATFKSERGEYGAFFFKPSVVQLHSAGYVSANDSSFLSYVPFAATFVHGSSALRLVSLHCTPGGNGPADAAARREQFDHLADIVLSWPDLAEPFSTRTMLLGDFNFSGERELQEVSNLRGLQRFTFMNSHRAPLSTMVKGGRPCDNILVSHDLRGEVGNFVVHEGAFEVQHVAHKHSSQVQWEFSDHWPVSVMWCPSPELDRLHLVDPLLSPCDTSGDDDDLHVAIFSSDMLQVPKHSPVREVLARSGYHDAHDMVLVAWGTEQQLDDIQPSQPLLALHQVARARAGSRAVTCLQSLFTRIIELPMDAPDNVLWLGGPRGLVLFLVEVVLHQTTHNAS